MRRFVSVLSLSIPAIGVKKDCCLGAVKIVRQEQVHLVHQVSDWGSGAAAYFGWMREAKRENTRCGL
jgi:hypothetical protein